MCLDHFVLKLSRYAILFAAAAVLQAQPSHPPSAAPCVPTQLVIFLTQFGLKPNIPVGYPFEIAVMVINDCGATVTDASVVVTFSNGDPPLAFQSLGNGQYEATYLPGKAPLARFAIIAQANTPSGTLKATRVVSLQVSGLQLSQTGLIFQVAANGPAPAARDLTISAVSAFADFTLTVTTLSGGNWLHVSPTAGTAGPAQTVAVTGDPSGLAAGDYYGLIRVDSPTAPNTPLFTTVVLNIVPAAKGVNVTSLRTSALRPAAHWPRATASDSAVAGCAATLFPVVTVSAGGAQPAASWPASIEVDVVDANDQPLSSSGIVTVSFSNGDPPFTLTSSQPGTWSGTWTPQFRASSVVVTAQAQLRDLQGCATFSTALQPSAPAPIVSPGGTVSAASYGAPNGISPGEMIAIFGQNLAPAVVSASSLPLPRQLGTTSIVIGGQSVPLLFTSSGQVNGVLPFDLPPDTPYSVVATVGMRISVPAPITTTQTNPAVFSSNGMGTGQAHAYRATSSGALILADAAHPALAGDVLVILTTGFGAVNFMLDPGSAAPTDRLVYTNESVTATVGGLNALVQFAGLAPGYTGLYQINLTVPPGTPSGNAVSLVLHAHGHDSFAVSVAIQ